MDHRAAACTGGAGSIHNGAGVALICHHQQQFVAGILQGALLLPCKGLVLGKEHQRPFAANAAQRHNERNAGARHIDLHFAAQILLDLLPAFCRYHGQQHRLRAVFQMFHHIPTPQDACFGKGSRVRFQPDRPGRCRRQQRHGACFQQGHGAVVRFPSGPEIPRCLCCIDRRRFCQHQRLRCTDHPPHLLAFLK